MGRNLTYLQHKALENWIRGGRKSKAKALRKAGYSEAIARVPSKVFDSPVVKRELERRGYGSKGVLNNHFPEPEPDVEKPKSAEFDPKELSKEDLQLLQKKLDEVPDLPQSNQREGLVSSFTPTTGTLEGLFDLTEQAESPITSKHKSYSSL